MQGNHRAGCTQNKRKGLHRQSGTDPVLVSQETVPHRTQDRQAWLVAEGIAAWSFLLLSLVLPQLAHHNGRSLNLPCQ